MDTIEYRDCREAMRDWVAAGVKVQTCVTSPPYFGLRDYGIDGQVGMEQTPAAYVDGLVGTFRLVRELLADDGTVWLNLGDSYVANRGNTKSKPGYDNKAAAGHANLAIRDYKIPGKPKDLIGIPWRVAFALQADGWYLRQDIIWSKPNPMPESVRDRCTKAHEYIFLLAKSERYYYDGDAIAQPCKPSTIARVSQPTLAEQAGSDRVPGKTNGHMKACFGGRLKHDGYGTRLHSGNEDNGNYITRGANKRSVWTVTTKPYKGAHFATFPADLIEPCILAGSRGPGRRCDCDEEIGTPMGNGVIEDPSIVTGRAGYNRPRRLDEGRRVITKREQRSYADQMKQSPHRTEMEQLCGSPFAHYIRTDDSGARPLPQAVLDDFLQRGWLVEPLPCQHPVEPGDTVLDPFIGSGTVAEVAIRRRRHYLGCELNPAYRPLCDARIARVSVIAK